MKYSFILARFLALALLAGGCASSASRDNQAANSAGQILPPIIAALTGPAALLLTNANGIQGNLTLILDSADGRSRRVSGQLLESQGRLYFESEPAGKSVVGRFSLIWDATRNQGWVMSDALQGMAPLTATNHYLGQPPEPVTDALDHQAGHPVQAAIVTFTGSDGQVLKYKVWQAADINQLALRIEPLDPSVVLSFTLSSLEKASPPEGMFWPPDDFTKYAGVEALLDELMAREHEVFNNDKEFRGTPGAIDEKFEQIHSPAPTN